MNCFNSTSNKKPYKNSKSANKNIKLVKSPLKTELKNKVSSSPEKK